MSVAVAEETKAKSTAPQVPSAGRGDIVQWYSPGSMEQSLAVVQRVNGDECGSLCLTVIPNPGGPIEQGWLDQRRQCVLHRDQDKAGLSRLAQYGTWDLTDAEKRRRAELAEIKSLLEELTTAPKSKK